MLLQFSLTNYKNFRETASLDMTEAKITEFKDHLINNPYDSLSVLPMVSVYGPNGSGKTNFLKGLMQLRALVLNAPDAMKENTSFFWNTDPSQPTEYDLTFRVKNMEYEYQLKIAAETVVEENLFGRSLDQAEYDVLFDRDNEGVYLCPAWESADVSALTEQLPLLYFLGINHKDTVLTNILNVFKNITFFSGEETSLDDLTTVLGKKDLTKELLSHLKNMQLKITGIRQSDDSFILTESIKKESVEYSWKDASLGTRQILRLLSALIIGRRSGRTLLLDNPELYLNPKVLGYLIRLAGNTASNPNGCQIIAATHENSTMNNSLFRRDELWLIAPQNDGSSILYTLALFPKENGEKVRKDETYFKQYLEGRYGACPQI